MSKFGQAACAIGGTLLVLIGAGCNTVSPELTRLQEDKKQLLTRVVDEQKRAESLTAELRAANQRLADAEKQLARIYEGRGRFASMGGPATYSSASSPMASNPASGSGVITREVQLGAPRDVTPSPSRPAEVGSVDVLGPQNGRTESGWVPKNGVRRGGN